MIDACSVEIHERCSSTMDLARLWVQSQEWKEKSPHPHFIQCYQQYAGRGKRERVWVSEKGNFFGTLVLPFPFEDHKRGDLSFLTAVAVGDVLKEIHPSLDLQFKWPNDIMVERKKIGGILLEYVEGKENSPFLSIGIGINFTSHPKHIPSSCLKEHINILPTLDYFRDLFIEKTLAYYDTWDKDGFSIIRSLWLKHAMNLNEFIQFSVGKETVQGIFQTINEKGGLVLKCQDEVERVFYTGEVFFGSQK